MYVSAKLLLGLMLLSAVTVIQGIVLTRINAIDPSRKPPKILRRLLNNRCIWFFCCQQNRKAPESDSKEPVRQVPKSVRDMACLSTGGRLEESDDIILRKIISPTKESLLPNCLGEGARNDLEAYLSYFYKHSKAKEAAVKYEDDWQNLAFLLNNVLFILTLLSSTLYVFITVMA